MITVPSVQVFDDIDISQKEDKSHNALKISDYTSSQIKLKIHEKPKQRKGVIGHRFNSKSPERSQSLNLLLGEKKKLAGGGFLS